MELLCRQDDPSIQFKKPYVWFMNHSGFVLALDHATVVIDYYTDPEAVLKPYLEREQALIFLVTHEHYDHWNPDILHLHSKRPSLYILDEGCRRFFEENQFAYQPETTVFVKPGDQIEALEALRQRHEDIWPFEDFAVFPSTDAGSSFFFRAQGYNYFHSGDLNDWDWQDEASEAMRQSYDDVLQSLKQWLEARQYHLDVSFVPMDGRLADRAAAGATRFLTYFHPTYLLPMHLNGGIEAPRALAKAPEAKDTKVLLLQRPGDRIDANGVRIPPCLTDVV